MDHKVIQSEAHVYLPTNEMTLFVLDSQGSPGRMQAAGYFHRTGVKQGKLSNNERHFYSSIQNLSCVMALIFWRNTEILSTM